MARWCNLALHEASPSLCLRRSPLPSGSHGEVMREAIRRPPGAELPKLLSGELRVGDVSAKMGSIA